MGEGIQLEVERAQEEQWGRVKENSLIYIMMKSVTLCTNLKDKLFFFFFFPLK